MGSKPKDHDDSELLQKGLPCWRDECGSSDAVAEYSDGHQHCFSCRATRGATSGASDRDGRGEQLRGSARGDDGGELHQALLTARPVAIRSRGLTQATCKDDEYLVRQRPNGDWEHLTPYRDRDTGALVGIKVRNTGQDGTSKDFYWIGSSKDQLGGAHRYPAGGKRLTIMEGEIDRATVRQAYALKWPVVTIPNGAAEAEKCFRKNLPYISSFDEVVIGFDMDSVGRAAAVACAKLLPPGKAKIVKWEDKDANAMQMGGKGDKITWCVHSAEPYRPDGIVDARQLTAKALSPPVTGIPWPWEPLTSWTFGRRRQELITMGAGTGLGKSDFWAEVIACDLKGETKDGHAPPYAPQAWGVFGFESGPVTTKLQIAGKLAGRRFHIPNDPDFPAWTREELEAVLDRMDQDIWNAGGRLFINDSFGAADWDHVKERMRYLRHAEDVTNFLVDPIGAMANGDEDERKVLDEITLQGAALTVELDASINFVSHLRRPADGPSHEEGGRVKLSQFRGSNGISMYSTFVFGGERNQQAEDEAERYVMHLRSLKDRFTGNSVGKHFSLVYDPITGSYDLPTPSFLED